jgi:formylglycine-generating enzyme required for sulfatase activity
MVLARFPSTGCAFPTRRVRVEGGTLKLAPSDWEAEGQLSPRTFAVQSFELDNSEVTIERWTHCVAEGRCSPQLAQEPGLPVTNVSPAEAERFCRSLGGRLPTRDEWIFAAARSAGRRYPWGQTGLVCRRAVFGLVSGPCAHGATSPDLAGSRPDGASPEGFFDLAGNVAEWAREPDGTYRARGGSFQSSLAGELKSWSEVALPRGDRAPFVGFRCAYETKG